MKFRAGLVLTLMSTSVLADVCMPGREALNSGRYDDALVIFNKLATKNHACAYYQLGVMYNFGKGVGQDRLKAQEYFQHAYAVGGSSVADAEVKKTLSQNLR